MLAPSAPVSRHLRHPRISLSGNHPQQRLLDRSRSATAIATQETAQPPGVLIRSPGVWESDILPMLEAAPGIRAVAVFEELCR
jgi:hypothetical protein